MGIMSSIFFLSAHLAYICGNLSIQSLLRMMWYGGVFAIYESFHGKISDSLPPTPLKSVAGGCLYNFSFYLHSINIFGYIHFQQNQAEEKAAICLDWLERQGKEKNK